MSYRRLAYSLLYIITRGLRGMAQNPLVQSLAVGTMAVCMLLLCTTILLFQNATRIVDDWGMDVPITVYMQPDAALATSAALAVRIEQIPEIRAARWIEPSAALERLERGLGRGPGAIAEIDPSILPTTVEVYLKDGYAEGFPERLAKRLSTLDEVEDVAIFGPWVQQARTLVATFRVLALSLGLLVSIACTVVAWSMIRLAVLSRHTEIEILEVVGSTTSFVRGPFIVQGLLQGALGAAVALGLLYAIFLQFYPLLDQGLSLLFAADSIRFFAPMEIAMLLGFGSALGALGSRAAVGHHAHS
ncbi:MAG: permease-like cell division protein FtsX [Nannocystaceae bacterium]